MCFDDGEKVHLGVEKSEKFDIIEINKEEVKGYMFDVWKNVLAEIEGKVDYSSFATWFKDVRLVKLENEVATISAPDAFKRTQIEKRYKTLILETLQANGANVSELKLIVTAKEKTKTKEITNEEYHQSGTEREGRVAKVVPSLQKIAKPKNHFESNLNPKYRMENFIVGSNNDLAVSMAKYVIEHPGGKYNPFFLYGGPGYGKTHLVEAIGNAIQEKHPEMKILYIPVSHFYSEFITLIRDGKGDDFASKYTQLDVLIIDDFQQIMGKDRSQEEFFNIFNDLYQANKQIIVTSDRLPSQIKTLDERLSSRLAMAGAIDLQMPNFEDKCAILKCKAELMGAEIEDEAIEYLAHEINTNIRDLESELSRILAISELRNISPLQIINDGYASVAPSRLKRGGAMTPEKIINKVAKYYGLTTDELKSKSRVANIKSARQVAMYFLRKELNMSNAKVANEVGVSDHTTAMHGIKKIEADMKTNYALREQVEEIKEKLYE